MRRWILAACFGLLLGGVAAAEPPQTHEILEHRTSGFWTSNRPAENGAYRWRLLGIGCALVLATGLVVLRLVKRANSQRPPR